MKRETMMRAMATFGALGLTMSSGVTAADLRPETIIAIERSALDRWGKGDPQGYLETYAQEITYFDPVREKRVDGLKAMKELLQPITGKVRVESYDMIDPRIQRHGNSAILTYNLVSRVRMPNGAIALVRWNCTEVYALLDGKWKIVHNHWSLTKPDLKQQIPE
jgi:ketosteroid isomerase-like protein